MSTALPIGSEIASNPPNSADGAYNLRTLQDLLDAFERHTPKNHGMLRSTAAKLGEFLDQEPAGVLLAALPDERDDFRIYLTQRQYAKASVRSYSNYLNLLLKEAVARGWEEPRPILPAPWQALAAGASRDRCVNVFQFFAKQGLSPWDITEVHLCDWIRMRVQRGRALDPTVQRANKFRRILVRHGYETNLSLRKVKQPDYSMSVTEFPDVLRRQVVDLIKWKISPVAPGRPSKGQHREITARRLEQIFRQLMGFVRLAGRLDTVTRMEDLVTEAIVTDYVMWILSDRFKLGSGVRNELGTLRAALRYHPQYSQIDIQWLTALIRSIPHDEEEELLRRKEEKFLPYETIKAIPDMIHADRTKALKRGQKQLALNVRNELLMKWLSRMPWRQRNLREARIGGKSPNLFKGKLPVLAGISLPKWLQQAQKENPDIEVWQFRFSKDETKMRNTVHCVLPLALVPLLEEYLNEYRPLLISGADPGTLFINDAGKRMSPPQVRLLVSELTLRYGGRIVTPHLFRDIFAFWWLERFPTDYLTVSKLLWHRSIATTLNRYGRRFNESAALCRMEDLMSGADVEILDAGETRKISSEKAPEAGFDPRKSW
jgi:integrase